MQNKSSPGDRGVGWDPLGAVSFWLNRASRVLVRLQDNRVREHGFAMGQMPVLHALQEGASLTQRELAERARVEQPSMAELLARMTRDGIVERTANPNDARSSLHALTRKARARLPGAREALMQTERDLLAGFTPEEKDLLVAMLKRLVQNAGDAA